jgi:hypothetical protein
VCRARAQAAGLPRASLRPVNISSAGPPLGQQRSHCGSSEPVVDQVHHSAVFGRANDSLATWTTLRSPGYARPRFNGGSVAAEPVRGEITQVVMLRLDAPGLATGYE